jgi:hypothetical protein
VGLLLVIAGGLVTALGARDVVLADTTARCDIMFYTLGFGDDPDELVPGGWGHSFECLGPCQVEGETCEQWPHPTSIHYDPGFEYRCKCPSQVNYGACFTTLAFNQALTLYQSYCTGNAACSPQLCKIWPGSPSAAWTGNNPGHPSAKANDCRCQ